MDSTSGIAKKKRGRSSNAIAATSEKTKRGRPSNAAEQSRNEYEEPASSRASRVERINHGEKGRYSSASRAVETEPRGSREKKRVDYAEKRKYSSNNGGGEGEDLDAGGALRRKKHRTGKITFAPIEQEAHLTASYGAGKTSPAGRPSQSSQAKPVEPEGQKPEPTSNRAKRKDAARPQESAASREEPDRPSKKRGGPFLPKAQIAKLPLNSQTRNRGRSSSAIANQDEQEQPDTNLPKKRRGRPFNAGDSTSQPINPVENGPARNKISKQRVEDGTVTEVASKRKRRRRSSPGSDVDEIQQHTEIAHQRLVPREHKINRDVMDTKWNLLPSGVINRVSSLLNEAQRPVMHRLQSEQTRILAHSTISTIIKKVERRLKALPFPPSTGALHREEDFDLEKILKHNRNLESQLTVVHHSNDLLIADRKREEAFLVKETAALKRLEATIKEENSFNKAELKKLDHPLLKKSPETVDTELCDIILASKSPVDLTDLQSDANIKPIIKQINGHMESMQGNMEQIKDIGATIEEMKATVEDVLFKNVDMALYEHVVLG